MIKEVSLRGFKSFLDETISISQLTVLTGLNSSGKSTVIQALRILGNVAQNRYNPLLEGHGTIDELQNTYAKEPFEIEAIYDKIDDIDVSDSISYTAGDGGIFGGGFPNLIYVSADRFGPRTSIPIASDYQLDDRGDNVLNCIDHYWNTILDKSLIHPNSQGETFEFNLEAWLGTISPGVRFKSNIIKTSDSSYSEFNGHRAKNVGFGLSYTLPIIVALFISTIEKGSVVLLENPEAHLHPSAQTSIAEYLAKVALSHAEAGADIVAPSDMMDGRIQALREILDENGYYNTMIMSYSVKFASSFYAPFREAACSAPSAGNRKSYQMDPANAREAIREAELDIIEGTDFLMVKPALPYLDIIKAVKDEFNLPLVTYNVSGEYSMIMAGIENGYLREDSIMESLLSIKRAGADLIISNFTPYVLDHL